MSTWLIFLTMMNPTGACQTISKERIFAEDLARALPAFSAVPKDTIIGYSPVPGTRRSFEYPELKRIGAHYGVAVPPDAEACFEWRLQVIREDAVRSAIFSSLGVPSAKLEILEISKGLTPDGPLYFPLSGLSVSTAIDPATPLIWRGYVQYGKGRRYAVWARVRVAATMTRVVALQPLRAGEAVKSQQVRLETYDDFPLRNDIARSLDEVIERIPLRPIRTGSPVFRTDLAEPFQVRRGELVSVTAVSGAAQLRFDALAETSGRQGDVIFLKNTQSGRRFQARIEGKQRAILVIGSGGLSARVQ